MAKKKRRQTAVRVDGKLITPRKVCKSCKTIIPIDKEYCWHCFCKKMKGETNENTK